MRPDQVPTQLLIRGQLWRVLWRPLGDVSWREEKAWGMTYPAAREIHLDEQLRYDPSLLQATWLHELMHATASRRGKDRGVISDAQGEAFAEDVSAELARVLNQTGWTRTV